MAVFSEGMLWLCSVREYYGCVQWGNTMAVFSEGILWLCSVREYYGCVQ